MKSTLFRHALVALPLLVSTACGSSKPSTAKTDSPSGSKTVKKLADAPLANAFSQQAPAFRDSELLRYLPKSTVAAVVAASPIALSTALESTSIFKEYPKVFASLKKDFALPGGANLALPETWAKAGIAANAQSAIAMKVVDSGAIVYVSVTVSNASLLQATLLAIPQLAPGSASTHSGTSGEITQIQWQNLDNTAVVFRGQVATLIWAKSAEQLAPALKELSTVSEAESFSHTLSPYASFDFGQDVAGFVAFPALTESIRQDLRRDRGESYSQKQINDLEQKIERALAEGDQEKVAEMQEELEESMRWNRRDQLDRSGEIRSIAQYLAPLSTMPFGIHLDGPVSKFRTQLVPDPKSDFATLFSNTVRPFALIDRLHNRPLFLAAGHFNTSSALRMIEPLLYFAGMSEKGLSRVVENEIGVDLDTLMAHLEGEMSFAFVKGRDSTAQQTFVIRPHALLRLKDPVSTQTLLDSICSRPAVKEFAVKYEGKWALELPSIADNSKFRIAIHGDYLEAKDIVTEPQERTWNTQEKDLLQSPSNRAVMVFDPRLMALTLFRGYERGDAHYLGESELSAAMQAKKKALEEELDALSRQRTEQQVSYVTKGSKAFGALLFTAQNHKDGYAILGGLYGQSPHLGRGVQSFIEAVSPEAEHMRLGKETEREILRAKLDALQDKIYQLHNAKRF